MVLPRFRNSKNMMPLDLNKKMDEFCSKPFTLGKIILDVLALSFFVIQYVLWRYYIPDDEFDKKEMSVYLILVLADLPAVFFGTIWLAFRCVNFKGFGLLLGCSIPLILSIIKIFRG